MLAATGRNIARTSFSIRRRYNFCIRGWYSSLARNQPQCRPPLYQQTYPQRPQQCLFATTTAAASNSKSSSTGNIFLDHLGSIFLSAIGLIIAWLVRSYYNTQHRNLIRDGIENQAALDPIEMDDLRTANSELTVEEFRTIQRALNDYESLNYMEFVQIVRTQMASSKQAPNFTVQLGHLLDRVALDVLRKHNQKFSDALPTAFWLVLLTLAVPGSVVDRMTLLHSILDSIDRSNNRLTTMVGYLQDTCQLVPDSQIVPTTHKYPLQEYVVASPVELMDRYRFENPDHRSTSNDIELDDFCRVLRSKAICAWGECYRKKKFG